MSEYKEEKKLPAIDLDELLFRLSELTFEREQVLNRIQAAQESGKIYASDDKQFDYLNAEISRIESIIQQQNQPNFNRVVPPIANQLPDVSSIPTRQEIEKNLPSVLHRVIFEYFSATQDQFNEMYAAGQTDFSNIQFKPGIDFSGIDISNLDFSHSIVERAIFDNIHIDNFINVAEFGNQLDLGLIRKYLELGINVNSEGSNGHTALIEAAIEGNDDLLNLLLEYSVDVNFHPEDTDNAIVLAAQNDQFSTVRILARNGALVNSTNTIADQSERTPLHYAAEKNDVETVQCLIENGADVNAQDVHGLTPLMYADSLGSNDAIIYLLIQGNADLNIEDNEGNTIIDLAFNNTGGNNRATFYERLLMAEPRRNIVEAFFGRSLEEKPSPIESESVAMNEAQQEESIALVEPTVTHMHVSNQNSPPFVPPQRPTPSSSSSSSSSSVGFFSPVTIHTPFAQPVPPVTDLENNAPNPINLQPGSPIFIQGQLPQTTPIQHDELQASHNQTT